MASFLMGARDSVPSGAEVPQAERPSASFRRLTFMPTYRSDKNPVRFSDGDTARLLDILATESGGQLTMADFASCDVRLPPRKEGKEADQQPLIVVLGSPLRLTPGCKEGTPPCPIGGRRDRRPSSKASSAGEASWGSEPLIGF